MEYEKRWQSGNSEPIEPYCADCEKYGLELIDKRKQLENFKVKIKEAIELIEYSFPAEREGLKILKELVKD